MKKFFFFLVPFILFADINPFNAGLNSEYGLTPQEKAILQNKKDISKLSLELKKLKQRFDDFKLKLVSYDEAIAQIRDKLAAFNTILSELDAVNQSVISLKKDVNLTQQNYLKLNERVKNLEQNITYLNNEIKNIKASIKEMADIQNQNFKYLKNSIDLILKTIKQFQKPLSPKEAMKKAKSYFFAGELNKAKELFNYTLSKNYLPATSAYYLGEIAFKQKDYKKALAFYKKSVELYPKKTSFTQRLLYHTAISFEKLGNKNAAKLTLEKIIHDYPNSKYAKLAKKELEKLK
jgi:TolA-binding protein